jgi:TatD DNase family protein
VLTDTHCHLDFNKFDADRADVLLRAQQAGVARIMIPGTSWTSSLSAIKLAESHPMLYAAVGVHPTEASDVERSTLNNFRELAKNPKVKAIGEIGLDYYWHTAPHDLQQKVLQEQLDLAAELNLPVIIHFREKGDTPDGPCAADLMKMLEEWVAGLRLRKSPLAERPGVLHSFSGSRETAEWAIGLNFFLGVTGPVTYRKDRQVLIASLLLEHLLVETDAPFLPPSPLRPSPGGKKDGVKVRNEPALVTLIADKIATLHACNPEQAAAVTTANAERLFGWKD